LFACATNPNWHAGTFVLILDYKTWQVQFLRSLDCSQRWFISSWVCPSCHFCIALTRFFNLMASFLCFFSDENASTGSVPSELLQLTSSSIWLCTFLCRLINYTDSLKILSNFFVLFPTGNQLNSTYCVGFEALYTGSVSCCVHWGLG
jgi:ferredoxin